jgi:hypothetical protein
MAEAFGLFLLYYRLLRQFRLKSPFSQAKFRVAIAAFAPFPQKAFSCYNVPFCRIVSCRVCTAMQLISSLKEVMALPVVAIIGRPKWQKQSAEFPGRPRWSVSLTPWPG